MSKNPLVNDAAEELDNITREGFFGNESVELLKRRDSLPRNDFLYESLIPVFSNSNMANRAVAGTTLRLIEFYLEAIPHSPQEVVDTLTSFINGTESNPGLENMSSYSEYIVAQQSWKNCISGHEGQVLSDSQKRQVAMSLLNAYSKGVELIGKVFTQLIVICKIQKGEQYNINKIAKMTIYEKIEKFKELSASKYHILTGVIDRKIRNADSHLNATYSPKNEEYTIKYNGSNNKMEIYKVSFKELVLGIYPKIGMFIQGFHSSCIIMALNWSDRNLAQKAIKNIEKINNGGKAEW